MRLIDWLTGRNKQEPAAPRAAIQSSSGGILITTPDDLERALAEGNLSGAGIAVTPETAMRVATVYGCVRLITGTVANLPIDVIQQIDDDSREKLRGHPLTRVLQRQPNVWQTPSQFKRMMQAHVLLRGNAYALILRSRNNVIGLVPMHPDRVKVEQRDDMLIEYEYTRQQDGRRIRLSQNDVMHVVQLTLDGVNGVSPITYARETIGSALAMEGYGSALFKNGARPSNVLIHPRVLGQEGRENLRSSLDEYRAGGESEGKALILEEGMTVSTLSLTSEDAQWIESRQFSRTDIAMFFGVPPFMLGDTEKSTSWGTGLEQQSTGYVQYTAEDHLTAWEETIARDLIKRTEPDIFAAFDRSALVRGDIETRFDRHVKSLQWGIENPNEIRARENLNPRDGGDVYYDPPNTAGGQSEDNDDDTSNTAGSQAASIA